MNALATIGGPKGDGEDLILAKIDRAKLLLSEAKTAQQVKEIADGAEVLRSYAKRVKLCTDTINEAMSVRLFAERRLGEMLAQTEKNKGAKGSIVTGAGREPVKDETPTLAELGVTKKSSAKTQKYASVPLDKFEEAIQEQMECGREITTAETLRRIDPKPKRATRSKSRHQKAVTETLTEIWTLGKINVLVDSHGVITMERGETSVRIPLRTLEQICEIARQKGFEYVPASGKASTDDKDKETDSAPTQRSVTDQEADSKVVEQACIEEEEYMLACEHVSR